MKNRLLVIKTLLKQILLDIDAGNSNMTEEEVEESIEFLKRITDKDKYYSREEAAEYLHMNLQWSKKVLDDYIETHKYRHHNKYTDRTKY